MRQDTRTDQDQRPAAVPASQGHVCLGCGCRIAAGVSEISVPLRGRLNGRTRYRHADDADCAAALRAPQPNVALIGRYEALPTFAWPGSVPGPGPEENRCMT
jgi:hypothetical protein